LTKQTFALHGPQLIKAKKNHSVLLHSGSVGDSAQNGCFIFAISQDIEKSFEGAELKVSPDTQGLCGYSNDLSQKIKKWWTNL